MRWPLAALLVLLAAFPSLSAPGRAPAYALVGGRVITVGGPTHEKATVVVRDGLIEAVGPGVRPPADARVIDAAGLVITPGLVDGFSGIGLPAAAPRGGTGGAADRPAGGASPAPLAPQALALDRLRVADVVKARDLGITSALVVPREGVLPGRSVLINTAGERPEEMAVRHPAAMHLHMATLARQYPGSLMGTMAHARQALLDAAYYRDTFAAYERSPRGKKRPRYDAARAAWAEVLAGREPLVVTARRENDVRRALALGDEFKVKVVVAGAMQAAPLAGLLKSHGVPLLVSVNYDPPSAGQFFGAADEDKERREIAEAERNPARLHEAGVKFALVSGHAPDFLAGVRKAIERGLPRETALAAVTQRPAEALGVADRLGTIEVGKIANLVAWSGEPLTKEARPRHVFVDGEPYEPEERPERGARDADASPAPAEAPSTNQPRERQPEERAPERKPGPEAPEPGPTPGAPAAPRPSPSPTPHPEVLR